MYKYNKIPDTIGIKNLIKYKNQHRNINIDEAIKNFFIKQFDYSDFFITASGRHSLQVALSFADNTKEEVITPAFGCSIIPLVIRKAGKKPVFVDINKDTFSLNVEQVKSKISDKTCAVIVVHEFGNPVRKDDILEIRRSFRGLLIEDAAISAFTRYDDDTLIGKESDFTIFSGSIGKPLSSYKWGGLGINNDKKISLSFQKKRRDLDSYFALLMYNIIKNNFIYSFSRPFINYLVNSDSNNVNLIYDYPSDLDNRVIYSTALNQIVKRKFNFELYSVLLNENINTIKYTTSNPTLSRIPFYVNNSSELVYAINKFKNFGIEVSRPYSDKLFNEGKYPNSENALNKLLCFTVKNKVDNYIIKNFSNTIMELKNNNIL